MCHPVLPFPYLTDMIKNISSDWLFDKLAKDESFIASTRIFLDKGLCRLNNFMGVESGNILQFFGLIMVILVRFSGSLSRIIEV